ncbi:MAG: hypothetical protein IAC58_02975 [Firmicutes bacterium]|uniref:Uncharacterized protein n=1 Tax=Candidatus Onthovivens merdipullorum TaxID=2840889 RepID=A0A9D9DIS4_9BACL|nr:hypothetical protein [Candidatus Onthovivens merdipullorum]
MMILRNLINNILYKKKLDNFLNEAYYLTLPLFENFVRARYVKLFVNEENIYEYINDFENELTNNFETKKEIYNFFDSEFLSNKFKKFMINDGNWDSSNENDIKVIKQILSRIDSNVENNKLSKILNEYIKYYNTLLYLLIQKNNNEIILFFKAIIFDK